MKNEKKHTVRSSKSKKKTKAISLTNILMTVHFPGLVQTSISGGVKNTFMGPNHSVTINVC